MSIFRKNKTNDILKEDLLKQILILIEKSKYELISLEISQRYFGNAIVEIEKDNIIVRFVDDRGDVHYDQRLSDSDQWFGQKLIFTHKETRERYKPLIDAIEEFVNS